MSGGHKRNLLALRIISLGSFEVSANGRRMPPRLPGFDCAANGGCSEVDRNAQRTRGYGAEKNEPANPSGANFFRRSEIQIVFLCDGT